MFVGVIEETGMDTVVVVTAESVFVFKNSSGMGDRRRVGPFKFKLFLIEEYVVV